MDIAAPGSGPFTFVDHELDLWCDTSGAGIVDQEELDAAEAAGHLSQQEATTARMAADELHHTFRHGYADAFAGWGWSLLKQARQDLVHRA